mgnify:CR=1 FL=1
MQDEAKASTQNRDEKDRSDQKATGTVTPDEAAELARNEAEGAPEGASGDPSAAADDADPVARLQTQVEVLEAEKSALKDQMLRAVAEAGAATEPFDHQLAARDLGHLAERAGEGDPAERGRDAGQKRVVHRGSSTGVALRTHP